MKITYGRIQSAQKVVIYGPEGIGKSTFASRFPNPIFIDTEGSTKHMDVARLPNPVGWQDVLDEVNYIANNPQMCGTLVIDTADWAEQKCIEAVCKRAKKKGIEDFAYGKGYIYVSEEWQQLLSQLEKVIEHGVNVVITAHAKMRKFEQPDEMGAYDRWEMKLSKYNAPLLKEWADMVLFANYKTFAVRTDDGKAKAQGGERTMYTTHHPCWDAKNRHGLESEVRFSYESIRHCIEDGVHPQQEAPQEAPQAAQQVAKPAPQAEHHQYVKKADQVSFTEQAQTAEAERDMSLAPPDQREPDIPEGIPQALAQLMRENSVDSVEIQMAVYDGGYYPPDTPISAYDPDFIEGCLIGAWPQVFKAIQKNREGLPF